METYDQLKLREIFHLEFLRNLNRKVKTGSYALKGGVNLRFFFRSFRYSEDLDLDVAAPGVAALRDLVMKILETPTFTDTLKPFGIERVVAPDISKAKQTETTQRFKVHLLTASGEDLFTKIEFSRRGIKGEVAIQPVSEDILRAYMLPPLLVAHYTVSSAIAQKIEALAARKEIQARDVFDLYILNSQYTGVAPSEIDKGKFAKARENIFEISFGQFRDTVLSYLAVEDQATYNAPAAWDEIKLKAAQFIDELKVKHA